MTDGLSLFDLLNDNKDWIFSGIGASILSGILAWITRKFFGCKTGHGKQVINHFSGPVHIQGDNNIINSSVNEKHGEKKKCPHCEQK